MIDVIILFSLIGVGMGIYGIKKIYSKKTLIKNVIFKNRFKINKENIKKYNLEDKICCICLDNYHIKCKNHNKCDTKCYQLFCNHIYHKKCIIEWLNEDIKCPLCNQSLQTKCGKTLEQLQIEMMTTRLNDR